LVRTPRSRIDAMRGQARLLQVAGTVVFILASLFVTMFTVDAWAIIEMRRIPTPFVDVFHGITNFGKSGWLLFPLLGLLIIFLAACTWARPRFAKLVLGAVAIRLGFLFVAIGAPGLFTSIVKVIIGRARPYISSGNPFVFDPFALHAQNMSLPSGHSTSAFAAAIAIGAVWPRIGAAVWVYALLIGVSRVIVTAHFPSDVLASAAIGIVGSLLVRNYFAARRLVFCVRTDGQIRALPGPSFRRSRSAVASLLTGRAPRRTSS